MEATKQLLQVQTLSFKPKLTKPLSFQQWKSAVEQTEFIGTNLLFSSNEVSAANLTQKSAVSGLCFLHKPPFIHEHHCKSQSQETSVKADLEYSH